jgi:predicted acylesterase/phospholipase RssA
MELVLSGAGLYILNMIGKLHKTNIEGIWKLEDIVKIKGSSAGCIMAVILLLKYDWDTIINYFIERPWEDLFKINLSLIISSYESMGLYGKDMIYEILSPLFLGQNIDLKTITMKGFYELNKVPIEIYATEITEYKLMYFSFETTPDVLLLDAICASTAIPLLFQPVVINDKCYADGGIICNFPNTNTSTSNKTIGFYLRTPCSSKIPTNLQEYISGLINKVIKSNELQHLPQTDIFYEICVKKPMTELSGNDYLELLNNPKSRRELYTDGFSE